MIETLLVLATIGLMAAIIGVKLYNERVGWPATFAAWSKQTGNPRDLTYAEWRALMRVAEKYHDPTVIFDPDIGRR